MNRYGHLLIALGTALTFSLATHAQQAPAAPAEAAQSTPGADSAGLPSVQTQLKVLTERLGLTDEQQGKIEPILKALHDKTETLMQDQNLSQEERLDKVRPARHKADAEIRAVLSDDQKEKLDRYEQGPHPEMHGNLTGAPPAQQ